jgi:hypothetical protein
MHAKDIEMSLAMCEVISRFTLFSTKAIFDEWTSCHSFDLIFRAIEFCREYGINDIHEAMNHLVKSFIIETTS